jgi:hypothetical protein
MEAELINAYIDRLINKNVEQMKVLILLEARTMVLENKNAELHKKVEELEKKVSKKKPVDQDF